MSNFSPAASSRVLKSMLNITFMIKTHRITMIVIEIIMEMFTPFAFIFLTPDFLKRSGWSICYILLKMFDITIRSSRISLLVF